MGLVAYVVTIGFIAAALVGNTIRGEQPVAHISRSFDAHFALKSLPTNSVTVTRPTVTVAVVATPSLAPPATATATPTPIEAPSPLPSASVEVATASGHVQVGPPSPGCPAVIIEVFGERAPAACAISYCESKWDANATGSQSERGLFQVHPRWHADATYDPLGNTLAAYRISGGGWDWSAWTCRWVLG